MFLKRIKLINFRNFKEKELIFDKNINLIIGKNSLGKTNILESIHFLINGIGFREEKEEELINFYEKESKVFGDFLINSDFLSFSIFLKLEKTKKLTKKFYIEKSEKKHFLYQQEQTNTVLFSPEQLEIIIGSPEKRRRYFDKIISFLDSEYKKKLINYEQALRKRNKILELKSNFIDLNNELNFWDDYLIKNGNYLTQKREEYINFLNLNQKIDFKFFSIKYLKNEINRERLKNSFEESIKYKKTIVGPQRDDFEIYLLDHKNNQDKNIHKFGSRSEQRLAIFWLKINEIKYIEKNKKIKPLILLDDIFSELDENNKKIIFPIINNYQTIASSVEKIDFDYCQYIYL
ncbi:MAG: DNA replication and repair protein RecF [Patescibacteria group bacterium]|nr:DNA replication and repair protein RecF [Patescibacteria group bacterium]